MSSALALVVLHRLCPSFRFEKGQGLLTLWPGQQVSTTEPHAVIFPRCLGAELDLLLMQKAAVARASAVSKSLRVKRSKK